MVSPSETDRESDRNKAPFDHAQPLSRVVVCCTSIPPNRRVELEDKIKQLGGTHKYDLTADVTHLIVGHYDTPKYRHVAKERPDIKPMSAGWIDTLTALWTDDVEIDFAAVEKEGQLLPLETNKPDPGVETDEDQRLVCSITGFHEPELRCAIIGKITDNGGVYMADLDRKAVTHLIACDPDGKKYKAARRWGIKTVSRAWLDETVERGMILDEQFFDSTLPPDEQGKGAWVRPEERRASLGKRARSVTEEGQRKLRKTASMKLTSQRDTLWGDILRRQSGSELGTAAAGEVPEERVEVADSGADLAVKHAPRASDAGAFATCTFFIAGFDEWREGVLKNTIDSLEGTICGSIDELTPRNELNAYNRYLIVPQASQPDTHPQLSPGAFETVEIVTEFFIEKCLHRKTLCDAKEQILGRPFPQFPIDGFQDLSICTGGFKGVDLNHVEKSIKQLGARYATRLNETTSLLVCTSLEEQRKEKLRFALENSIPVVSADWLWECASTGFNIPVQKFMFPQLKQDPTLQPKTTTRHEKKPMQRTRSEPVPKTNGNEPRQPRMGRPLVDETAFASDKPVPSVERGTDGQRSESDYHFHTAKTHQLDSFGSGTVAEPLSESTNAVNKSPSPQKAARSSRITKSANTTITQEHSAPIIHDDDPGKTQENNDRDINSHRAETPPEEREQTLQAELKRKQDEQKATERADLASKIMASKMTGLVEGGGKAPASAATAEDQSPHEEDAGTACAKPPRRRKGIFGRAVSNVSTASSGSHESVSRAPATNKHFGPDTFERRDDGFLRTRSDGAAGDAVKERERGGGHQGEGDSQLFSSTQIGYGDPEGAQLKAEMLKTMTGDDDNSRGGGAPVIGTSSVGSKASFTKAQPKTTRRKGF